MSDHAASRAAEARPGEAFVAAGRLDTSHAVRRLRWFASSFRSEVARLSAETGVEFHIDEARIARAFVGWLRAFKAQRPPAGSDLRAFSCFAAGLMLQQLIRHEPLTVTAISPQADAAHPARFWPEGYAYVDYCLGVCAAVLKQEFGTSMTRPPDFLDLRLWWSFRENVREDPGLAVGFFELFCGMQPNWTMPTVFSPRLRGPATQLSGAAHDRALAAPAAEARS